MNNIIAAVGLVLAGFVLICVVGLVAALPTWLLWNWLMPTIFGLKSITIFQAWGLIVLVNCLFKNSANVEKKG